MIFVYGDDNSKLEKQPVVVYVLLAMNVLIFCFQYLSKDHLIASCAMVPYEISYGVDLEKDVVVQVGDYQYSIHHEKSYFGIYGNLLFSTFMHGGLLHIIGNMLYLIIFGDQIEVFFGKVKFIALYVVFVVVASLTHIFFNANSVVPVVGASGGVAGLLGAYLVLHPENKLKVIWFYVLQHETEAWIYLALWFVMQFIFRNDGVAHLAHIGGFVAGIVAAVVFKTFNKQSSVFKVAEAST